MLPQPPPGTGTPYLPGRRGRGGGRGSAWRCCGAQGLGLHSAACTVELWDWRPVGQDSCPLPPSAVPNSHRGQRGRGDHPHHPPAGGVMPFCWKTSLAFCAGSGASDSRGKMSSVPQFLHLSLHLSAVETQDYGKGVPPSKHAQQCPAPPAMAVVAPRVWGGKEAGKSHRVSPERDACLGGPNPGRPCVGRLGGGMRGVKFLPQWRGCDSCPGPLPVGWRQLCPETGARLSRGRRHPSLLACGRELWDGAC